MLKKKSAIGFLILISFWLPSLLFAVELKTAAQESAPKYFITAGNTMGGICVEIMQAIENIDRKIQFTGYQKFVPFKRLQNYLETGQLDVFFGFKKTEERKSKYIFLDFPLYQLNYVIAARADDKIRINCFNDMRSLGEKGKLLTVYGTAASRFLHEKGGLLFEDDAKSPAMLLNMLIAGRGRFAFYHDLGLQNVIKRNALGKKVKILPMPFFTYYHFAAFSKNIPAETIDKVRTALEKIKNDGELEKICGKYLRLK